MWLPDNLVIAVSKFYANIVTAWLDINYNDSLRSVEIQSRKLRHNRNDNDTKFKLRIASLFHWYKMQEWTFKKC